MAEAEKKAIMAKKASQGNDKSSFKSPRKSVSKKGKRISKAKGKTNKKISDG